MNDFLSLAKKRYSVRSYTARKVEKEKLDRILQTAVVAPTGANRQPFHILVIESEAGLAKARRSANFFGAPLLLVVCANPAKAWRRSYDLKTIEEIDASIVTDHMMLQAADLGLGSLWLCNFQPDTLKRDFEIPDSLVPVNLLAVGYTDEAPKSPERHGAERRPAGELVTYERF